VRFFYNLLLILNFPLLYFYLLHRRAIGKESALSWPERWGKVSSRTNQGEKKTTIWVHAVSVGEVMAAVPILRELRAQYPNAHLVLSTTTSGGREVADKQVPTLADQVIAFPIDLPWVVAKSLGAIRPDLIILFEWEIWPNFIAEAKKIGAGVVVVNGRISDKGLRRGKRAMGWLQSSFALVDLFLMQSEEDAQRAEIVGVPKEKIQTLGNTKFDEAVTPLSEDKRQQWREELGIPKDAFVWVCGSTRDDPDPNYPCEEAQLAYILPFLFYQFPTLHVIVAPRHLERVAQIVTIFNNPNPPPEWAPYLENIRFRIDIKAEKRTLPIQTPALRSEKQTGRLLILDTFGELSSVYAIADIAFVGGSLVNQGGQSVFQPLSQGVPVVFGPHMQNQRDISALAILDQVGFERENAGVLVDKVTEILNLDKLKKQVLSQKCRSLIEKNQGVSKRYIEKMGEFLDG
jgi:3-deoxy-D-manno-octulosonic-acid transferase